MPDLGELARVCAQLRNPATASAAAIGAADELERLDRQLATMRSLLLQAAAHCQGGHSDAGLAISREFGLPFPVNMGDLVVKARDLDLNPARLWPWLHDAPSGRRYFTAAEITEASHG